MLLFYQLLHYTALNADRSNALLCSLLKSVTLLGRVLQMLNEQIAVYIIFKSLNDPSVLATLDALLNIQLTTFYLTFYSTITAL